MMPTKFSKSTKPNKRSNIKRSAFSSFSSSLNNDNKCMLGGIDKQFDLFVQPNQGSCTFFVELAF